MVTLNLYIEDELINLQEIDTVFKESDKLEKLLSKVVPDNTAVRFKNEIHLALSICYFKMAIFIYSKGGKSNAYHLAVMGLNYLKKCKGIEKESKKYPDVIKTQMRYCFLFSFLSPPIAEGEMACYDFPGEELLVNFFSEPVSLNDLFVTTDQLHREGLMDSAMSAYQGLIAIAGFTQPHHQLGKDTRLILMTDALKRLTPTHRCYQELQAYYDKYLKNLNKTPLTIMQKNIFTISKWYVQAMINLCDRWFFVKIKNTYLFQPSRLFKSVGNVDFNKKYTKTETFPAPIISDSSQVDFTIVITELELIKFVCHLHPLSVTVGSSPYSPVFIIDLALQKHGYIGKNFEYEGDDKLKELSDPKKSFSLFQTIKDFAGKYKIILPEDEIKEDILKLSYSIKQRMGAVNFFRQFYFEALHFNTAFYLLNKGISFANDQLAIDLPLFTDAYNKVKLLINTSFCVHMENNHILSTNINANDKLSKHKTHCERLIQHVVNNRVQVLIQIQIYDPRLGHAIYGILEPIIEQSSNAVTGIQLIISNGGLGCEHHAKHKTPKEKYPVGDRIPITWQNTDWNFFVGHAAPQSSTFIKYKGIKIDNLTNDEAMKAFCYYLMLCRGGYYLTHENKVCTAESFINAIYNPKLHPIKNKEWIKQPNLDSLILFDTEQYMPQQVMGNCTVYNAMYAIKYAKNLNALQIWYLTYVIEAGIDELCSLLKISPPPSLHSNPSFSS